MATKQSELEKLKAENKRLKAELKNTQKYSTRRFNWKRIAKWTSLAVAGGLFVAGSILFYVGMTLTNTNRFMEVASPLIQQPAVQQSIAKKTTDALFAQVDTQQLALEVLPDKADFLAPQISAQIQTLSTKEAEKVLASESFQNVWDTTLRTSHEKLITGLKNYEGDGTISINDVYARLSAQLSETKLSFLAGKQLPPKIGDITIIESSYLPIAHNIVANITLARILTIALLLGLLVLSVFLSDNRRKGLIHVGALIALLSLAILVSLRIGQVVVSNQVQPDFKQAAIETWQVLVNPYKIILWGQALFGTALAFVAWIGSNSKSAKNTRNRFTMLLEGKIHESIFKGNESGLAKWVGKKKKLLIGIVSGGFVLSFLFITLSASSVALSILIALVLVSIIEIIGAPQNNT